MKKHLKSKLLLIGGSLLLISACSINPATGERQFTALMSPAQEVQVGAEEHKKIVAQMGLYQDAELQAYVERVGKAVTKNTERPEVQYKFFIVDSPIVNAFALPGGYIYVSRGLLALANTEAELAAVLGHEAGHITARHSAERYSHGVLASLGAAVVSLAVDNGAVSQAAGIGSDLYLKSYSRSQENEADALGIRYLSRSDYDERAMTSFLSNLQAQSELEARLEGRSGGANVSYFSTHPATSERVSKTITEARQYEAGGVIERTPYLKAIDGVTYGDSADQGFARGQDFYHPKLGFTFSVPNGFKIINNPAQVVATSDSGAVVVFDMAGNTENQNALNYLTQTWIKNESLNSVESITVNGMPAAAAAFPGTINNRAVTIRVVAIQWQPNKFVRFQIAIPNNASSSLVDGLKRTTYSFRNMTANEQQNIRPYRVRMIVAGAGDSVASLARRQPFTNLQEERFRVLNGLKPGENLSAGQAYKIIVD